MSENYQIAPEIAEAEVFISDEELEQRVAIIRRFRELLVEQRDRFQNYLTVLDKQKTLIESGSADDLSVHIEMEEKIIADIFSVQKCIEPMRAVFANEWAENNAPTNVAELQNSLETLKSEAVLRVNENKKLLQSRMNVLRTEMKTIKNNPFILKRKTIYNESNSASLLDING
ncbi:MAG: flagellar biosynthesis protein FlgN [Spirochaetaceae bacterium]|jgi:hypothetical protein|nr:flagellar biosynthesis protein FlgN [Spirochaetaceae bacterium]